MSAVPGAAIGVSIGLTLHEGRGDGNARKDGEREERELHYCRIKVDDTVKD